MVTKALRGVLLATGICGVWAGTAYAQGVGLVSLFADVRANGVVNASSGLERARHPAQGTYVLFFTRDVANCGIVASPNGNQGGQASVRKLNAATRVQVSTRAANGTAADLPFTAIVTCSP